MNFRKNCFNTFTVALCVAAVALSSCKKSAQENKDLIVGNWQVQGEKSTIEFKTDGTIRGNDDGEAEIGTYKFIDATHIQMVIYLNKPGNPPAAGMPATMTLDCGLIVQDSDNIEMKMGMSGPGDTAKDKTESVHFKRIK